MKKSISIIVFLLILTLIGCKYFKSKDYYRNLLRQRINCEISENFEVLEHTTSSGISTFELIFILKFSEDEFNSIINCIGTENLNGFKGGYSLNFKIDYDTYLFSTRTTIR
jgi:hypothetical protein